jgi:hypothetical protein
MDIEKNGDAYEYSRVEEIIMAIIVAGMIVGSILSQVFFAFFNFRCLQAVEG